jgi:GTP-binding protein Era
MNDSQKQKRVGYVALLGTPNAGKSTLLNAVLGQKLAIVTPKAQTTRTRMQGIAIHHETQLIFIDAPGVFQAKQSFEKAMVSAAWHGVDGADLVLWMHDCRKRPSEETEQLIERLSASGKPVVLILNKTDLLDDKQKLLPLIEWFSARVKLVDSFMISALKDEGVADFMDFLAAYMPAGEWLFPKDHLTDAPMRFIAAELTREQCFLQLREELPYALHVETESFETKTDGSYKINQVIVIENERQKKIVLGKGGQMLKQIGAAARQEVMAALDNKVHLFLFVKVRNNWKQDSHIRAELGLL